jgi:hypothetical protein
LVWEWNESENFKETKTIHTVSVLRFLSISLLILLLSEQTATNIEWWLMPTQFSLENSTLLRRAASLWCVSVFTGDLEPSQSPLHLGHPQLIGTAVHSLNKFLHDGMSTLKYNVGGFQQPSSPSPTLISQDWVYWKYILDSATVLFHYSSITLSKFLQVSYFKRT